MCLRLGNESDRANETPRERLNPYPHTRRAAAATISNFRFG